MNITFVALSGPSSCGKTTIAYLLKHIFPNIVYILHADDFCKEFDQILTVNGYLDCDGLDAIDYVKMAEVLDFMKTHDGEPPATFKSWQDDVFPGREEAALKSVDEYSISKLKKDVGKAGTDMDGKEIVLVDGFLLYNNPEIRRRLNVKLFFRLTHQTAKERRFMRQGYREGEKKEEEFWKTEDYFEKMVWRCYREQHGFMFVDGDVEGRIEEGVCGK